MAADPPGRQIYITNFLNPNYFHFKFQDELFSEDLHKFENEVAAHANHVRQLSRSKLFTPHNKFIVAAYIIEIGKWVRAKINQMPSKENGLLYVVLAIDHGMVFYVDPFFISSLPTNLIERRVCGSALQGSVYCTIPASKVRFRNIYVLDKLSFSCCYILIITMQFSV